MTSMNDLVSLYPVKANEFELAELTSRSIRREVCQPLRANG